MDTHQELTAHPNTQVNTLLMQISLKKYYVSKFTSHLNVWVSSILYVYMCGYTFSRGRLF